MLQLSDNAASALQEARDAQDLPESFGVRIFGEPDPDGRMSVALGFTEQPADGDHITEQAGTQVFIAPEVAEPLSDSVMDVQQTAEGPRLVLVPQQQE